jgi:hypothetical protein
MSRAINLAMSSDEALKHCTDKGIGVSALEALPGGGVRLVCSSGDGAEQVRRVLKRKLLDADLPRTAFRPTRPLW